MLCISLVDSLRLHLSVRACVREGGDRKPFDPRQRSLSFSASVDMDVTTDGPLTWLAMAPAATKVSCFKRASVKAGNGNGIGNWKWKWNWKPEMETQRVVVVTRAHAQYIACSASCQGLLFVPESSLTSVLERSVAIQEKMDLSKVNKHTKRFLLVIFWAWANSIELIMNTVCQRRVTVPRHPLC